MVRRLSVALAVGVFVASAAIAILLPSRLTCVSMGYPEGTRCAEGRIDFEDHGPFVSIAVDRRYPDRFAIVVAGAALGTGLLLIAERRQPGRPAMEGGGAGL